MHVTRSHTRNIECHIYPLFRIMLFATLLPLLFRQEPGRRERKLLRTHDGLEPMNSELTLQATMNK